MGVNNRRTPSNKEEQINEQLCEVHQALTDVGTPKEGWRKVEDPAFVTIVRTCNKLCTKAANISSLEEEDAARMRCTFNQITDILIEIKKIYLDVEQGIFEEEDQAKRFYESTTAALFSVWTACCDVTVQFTDILVQKLWDHSDEHKELLKSISRTSSTCEKLLVLMVDAVKHPLPEGSSISKPAIKGAKCCSQSLETVMSVLTSLPNAHSAEDAILDIITWMLYGLQHVAANVIRPEINTESEEKDDKLFDFSDSLIGLFAVLEDYETGPGLRPDTRKGGERSKPEESTQQTDEAKTDTKDNEAKKDAKEAAPEKKTETIHDCVKNLDRLSEEYSRFSETWLLNGKVGVVLDENDEDDITVLFRPEQYKELAKCSVKPCVMAERTKWLDEVNLADGEIMVSDIYVVNNGPLQSVKDVAIDLPVITTQEQTESKIHIKIKADGSWKEIEDIQQEMVADTVRVSFKTNNIEAFVAYIIETSDTHELTAEGSTYTSPTDDDIKVKFQSGTVEGNHNLKIKVLPYNEKNIVDYMEKCPNSIVGIVAVSSAIEVKSDEEIDMKKNTSYQIPIEEVDDKDTQIVVVRYNDEQVQILDKSQCHIKKSQTGVYTVETKGVWCVAVARIKKIFINMRDTIKKEFQVMHGKTQLCNIVTLIDDNKRIQKAGYAPFWLDCVDKLDIDDYLEQKKKCGFIEVKGSRSKDINMRRRENMNLAVDGQIKITDNLQYTPYEFTYLKGVDNHLCIPVEVKRDQEKMPYATFMFKDQHDTVLHSIAIPVRDLAELPSDEVSAVMNLKSEVNNIRLEMKLREESARNVLSHESLMCLSRQMTEEDANQLSEMLGVSSKLIDKFRESSDGDVVRTNFLILCEWRGNYSRSAMVDYLVSSLRSNGKRFLSDVIVRVRKQNRVIRDSDFK